MIGRKAVRVGPAYSSGQTSMADLRRKAACDLSICDVRFWCMDRTVVTTGMRRKAAVKCVRYDGPRWVETEHYG